MARKETIYDWITAKQASAILTEKSGHTVSEAYVRRLGNPEGLAKIEVKVIDGRTKLYKRSDVEAYIVQLRGDGSVRRVARAPRTQKAHIA